MPSSHAPATIHALPTGRVRHARLDRLRLTRLAAGTWRGGQAATGATGLSAAVALDAPSRIVLHRSPVVLEPGRIGLFAGGLEEHASSIVVEGELGILGIPPLLAKPWASSLPRRELVQVDARNGIPSVVAHLLSTLTAGEVEQAESPAWLEQHVVGFLSLAWLGLPDRPESRGSMLLRDAMEYIDEHLGESGLNLDRVARATRVSTRTLHRVFEPEGLTVTAWIRHRRLERCRAALADPSLAGYSVSEIATRWGFTDPAHFSRLFKAAYGISPRVHRDAQRTGAPLTEQRTA